MHSFDSVKSDNPSLCFLSQLLRKGRVFARSHMTHLLQHKSVSPFTQGGKVSKKPSFSQLGFQVCSHFPWSSTKSRLSWTAQEKRETRASDFGGTSNQGTVVGFQRHSAATRAVTGFAADQQKCRGDIWTTQSPRPDLLPPW